MRRAARTPHSPPGPYRPPVIARRLFFRPGNGYAAVMKSLTPAFFPRLALLLALLSLMPATRAQQPSYVDSLLGSWSGEYQVGNYPPLELVLRFTRGDNGALAAALDIPSQYRRGIPAERLSLNDRRITVAFPAFGAEFLGSVVLDESGQQVRHLSGDWNQGGEFVALRLEPHTPDE